MIHVFILILAVFPTEQIFIGAHLLHYEGTNNKWHTDLSPSQLLDWTYGCH